MVDMDLFSSPPQHNKPVPCLASKYLSNGLLVNLHEGDMFQQTADYMVVASNKHPKGPHAGGQAKGAWDALENAGDFLGLRNFQELSQQGKSLRVGYDVAVTHVGKEFTNRTGCRAFLHVAGPDCRIPEESAKRQELLQAAYQNTVLKTLHEATALTPHLLKLRIAFPLISIGIFQYPCEEFMKACLRGLSQISLNSSISIVIDLYIYKNKHKEELLRDFITDL